MSVPPIVLRAALVRQLERTAARLHPTAPIRAEACLQLVAELNRRFDIARLLADRNPKHVAADVGVSIRTVERWIVHGVTWDVADLIAARVCNQNPEHLFGPAWAALADAECQGPPTLFDDDLSDLVPQTAP